MSTIEIRRRERRTCNVRLMCLQSRGVLRLSLHRDMFLVLCPLSEGETFPYRRCHVHRSFELSSSAPSCLYTAKQCTKPHPKRHIRTKWHLKVPPSTIELVTLWHRESSIGFLKQRPRTHRYTTRTLIPLCRSGPCFSSVPREPSRLSAATPTQSSSFSFPR